MINLISIKRGNFSNKKNVYNKKLRDYEFNSLSFENVNFKYPSSNDFALKGINLTINSGEIIGIIGESGSGKSTFIDLLMGLLISNKGCVTYNFKKNNKLIRTTDPSILQEILSHVPQNIFLADSTIEQNIAFGINPTKINKNCYLKPLIILHHWNLLILCRKDLKQELVREVLC